MTFNESSPEAIAGQRGEWAVDRLIWHRGGMRLRLSDIHGGAAMFEGRDRSLIAPDRIYAGLADIPLFFAEVKWKSGPVVWQRERVLRHGVDLPNWHSYLEIERMCKIAGWLAIVQVKERRDSKIIKPILLTQSFKRLAECVNVDRPSISFPRGGAFWDVAEFVDKGSIDIGEAPLPETKLNAHQWEKPDRDGNYPHIDSFVRQPKLAFA